MKVGRAIVEKDGTGREVAPYLGLFVTLLLVTFLALGGPANAAVKTDEFAVSTLSTNQTAPAVGDNIVVWEDERDGLSSIYGKNLSTNTEFLVATGVSVKRKPVTDGKVVVWEDDRSGNSDIYGYRIPADLSTTGQEFPIASGPGDQRKPAIGGNTVVWEDNRSGKWGIYTYDLSANQETLVAAGGDGNKTNPAISGDTVVWQDDHNIVGNSNIHAKNLSTGQEFPVSTGDAFADTPTISGGIVVWRQENVANYDIFGRDLYAKDLQTGEVFQVTTNSSDQVAPAISGNVVVWEDHRDGNSNIFGKDLSTGQEFQITAGVTPQATPEINGETVVWESQRVGATNYGTYDVYGAKLDAAPAIPTGVQASGTNASVNLSWNANTESDLTGYNVYRSDSLNGTYTKLNSVVLSGTSYSDADAPKGSVSYYQIKALDAVNESGAGGANAAAIANSGLTLSASPVTLNLGGQTALSGKLTFEASAGTKPASDKRVFLDSKPAGQSNFTEIKSALTNTDGSFDFANVQPGGDTAYRVRFAGDPGAGMSSVTSSQVSVNVIMSTALTVGASPATLDYGGATTLSGKLSLGTQALSGKEVVLEQRAAGASTFVAVSGGRVTTGADGTFSVSGLRPTINTYYRASFAGDASLEPAVSAPTLVSVKAKVSVSVPPTIKPAANPGVSISGQVVTTRAGKVQITITRNGKVIVKKTVSITASRFKLSQKLPGKGKYAVKAAVSKSATHLGNTSVRRFSVR